MMPSGAESSKQLSLLVHLNIGDHAKHPDPWIDTTIEIPLPPPSTTVFSTYASFIRDQLFQVARTNNPRYFQCTSQPRESYDNTSTNDVGDNDSDNDGDRCLSICDALGNLLENDVDLVDYLYSEHEYQSSKPMSSSIGTDLELYLSKPMRRRSSSSSNNNNETSTREYQLKFRLSELDFSVPCDPYLVLPVLSLKAKVVEHLSNKNWPGITYRNIQMVNAGRQLNDRRRPLDYCVPYGSVIHVDINSR